MMLHEILDNGSPYPRLMYSSSPNAIKIESVHCRLMIHEDLASKT